MRSFARECAYRWVDISPVVRVLVLAKLLRCVRASPSSTASSRSRRQDRSRGRHSQDPPPANARFRPALRCLFGWHHRIGRQIVDFGFIGQQEKRVQTFRARLACRIRAVKIRPLFILRSCRLLELRAGFRPQIIHLTEDNRICRTCFRACGLHIILQPVITQSAFPCAAIVGKPVNDAEGARHHAIPAAIANIRLNVHRVEFRSNDRSCWTGFQGTCALGRLQTSDIIISQENLQRFVRPRNHCRMNLHMPGGCSQIHAVVIRHARKMITS